VLVDSHCHLDLLDFDRLGLTSDEVVKSAKAAGVERILTIGINLTEAQRVIDIANKYDGVFSSVGLHPSEKVDIEPVESDYLALASNPKVVAIGEMGLDYYYNKEGFDNQRERFRRQIRVARQCHKPIIVHTRDAVEDTMMILRDEKATECGGVMHCFTEGAELARFALDLGFYISFSGIVTFKNAKNVQVVAKEVPLNRILIETDAPYLTPVPLRGKPNQPANVRFVAEYLAQLKDVPYETVCEQTTANFNTLFKIDANVDVK
jgi:TatD DNase family protein